jgi:hypothetical protein
MRGSAISVFAGASRGTFVVGRLPWFITIALRPWNTYQFADKQNGGDVGLTLDDLRAALNLGKEGIMLL